MWFSILFYFATNVLTFGFNLNKVFGNQKLNNLNKITNRNIYIGPPLNINLEFKSNVSHSFIEASWNPPFKFKQPIFLEQIKSKELLNLKDLIYYNIRYRIIYPLEIVNYLHKHKLNQTIEANVTKTYYRTKYNNLCK